MTDSPLATKFVAAPDNWSRNGKPIKAITIHMAEGGGTVSWLTRNDGNSSHYVVEYTGRIVQMVAEARAAGSINPNLKRTTDDAPYSFLDQSIRYGVTAAKHCTGVYWNDPNAVVIAIEVEGFAVDGPNATQRTSLRKLVADIRHRHGALGILGHRDWQSYKPCPGHKIPWVDYGGHGSILATVPTTTPTTPPPTPEDPMGLSLRLASTTDSSPLDAFGAAKIKGTNHSIIRVSDMKLTAVADGLDLGIVQRGTLTSPLEAQRHHDPIAGDRTSVVAFNSGGELYVALLSDVTFASLVITSADTTPFGQADVDAAKKTAFNEGRAAVIAAGQAVPAR
jgi:hypothetical protein